MVSLTPTRQQARRDARLADPAPLTVPAAGAASARPWPAPRRAGLLATALAAAAVHCTAGAVELEGRLDLDLRAFQPEARRELTAALAGTLQAHTHFRALPLRAEAELFYRLDADDDQRAGGDIRQAYIQWRGEQVDVSLGWRRVFWGVTESRSLVDVINQDDRAGDIRGDEKLGQPMLQLDWHGALGSASLYLMPRGRKRIFSGADGYPRAPLRIDGPAGRFSGERDRPDLALRWQYSGRGFDVGLSGFDGSARDPDFEICARLPAHALLALPCAPLPALAGLEAPSSLLALRERLAELPGYAELETWLWQRTAEHLRLRPVYPRERRLGVDVQYLQGAWAWRLEALARERERRRSRALVAGVEYALPRFFATDWEVGLLAEYLYDQRRDDPFNRYFDDDLFIGGRVFVNDIAGSNLLGGVIISRDGRDRFYSLEAGRRLGEYWRATLTLRVQDGDGGPLHRYTGNQDQLRLMLQRYF